MDTKRVHHHDDTVEAHYSSLERASGPVVTYTDGSRREIKPKRRMKLSSAAVARNLEARGSRDQGRARRARPEVNDRDGTHVILTEKERAKWTT